MISTAPTRLFSALSHGCYHFHSTVTVPVATRRQTQHDTAPAGMNGTGWTTATTLLYQPACKNEFIGTSPLHVDHVTLNATAVPHLTVHTLIPQTAPET